MIVCESFTMAWFPEDEVSPDTEAVRNRVLRNIAVVPAAWSREIRTDLGGRIERPRHRGNRAAVCELLF